MIDSTINDDKTIADGGEGVSPAADAIAASTSWGKVVLVLLRVKLKGKALE